MALTVLAAVGCDQPPEDVAPAPVVVVPVEATPAEVEPAPELAASCERHTDCRVLMGVCGRATPCNASSVDTMRRHIERVGRVATCGRGGARLQDTTPACIRGLCRALLGTPAEHRCSAETECTVLDGLCGPTEAVRSDQREAFEQRIEAMKSRGSGCGYGPRPTSIRAVCDDGLCVPRSAD